MRRKRAVRRVVGAAGAIGALTAWFLWCSLVRVRARTGLHCVTLCGRSTTRFATANARQMRWTPDILRT